MGGEQTAGIECLRLGNQATEACKQIAPRSNSPCVAMASSLTVNVHSGARIPRALPPSGTSFTLFVGLEGHTRSRKECVATVLDSQSRRS